MLIALFKTDHFQHQWVIYYEQIQDKNAITIFTSLTNYQSTHFCFQLICNTTFFCLTMSSNCSHILYGTNWFFLIPILSHTFTISEHIFILFLSKLHYLLTTNQPHHISLPSLFASSFSPCSSKTSCIIWPLVTSRKTMSLLLLLRSPTAICKHI